MKNVEYRRRAHSDTWHWRTDCTWWPVFPRNKYEDRIGKPKSGELCNQCLSKQRKAA